MEMETKYAEQKKWLSTTMMYKKKGQKKKECDP